MLRLPLLLQLHGLTTAGEVSLATLSNDHLRAALSALITLAYLIGHFRSASVTHLPGNASTLWEARPLRPQSSPIWNASQCSVLGLVHGTPLVTLDIMVMVERQGIEPCTDGCKVLRGNHSRPTENPRSHHFGGSILHRSVPLLV